VPRWFRGVRMNFAENVLFHGDGSGRPVKSPGKEDDKVACIGVREGSFREPMVHVSWKELRQRVGRMSNAMRARGVRKGDRVAIVASNSIDSLVVFLGVTALGGLFSSSSTDMGVTGVLDRLQQIEPQWLFMDDWAVYNGKTVDLRPKMTEIVTGMTGVGAFKGVVSQCRFPGRPADMSQVPRAMTWDEYLSAGMGNVELTFERVEFCDPFLIVYSSGKSRSAPHLSNSG
jgi:acetoacetyl-CoA synthetase